jgi:2-methylcitrate dehydratase PrpD
VGTLCKPRTRELSASVFTRHVYPTLGDLALSDVTRERIRTLLADKAAAGLARATLTNVLISLRAMLACAVDDGLRVPETLTPLVPEILAP